MKVLCAVAYRWEPAGLRWTVTDPRGNLLGSGFVNRRNIADAFTEARAKQAEEEERLSTPDVTP